MMRYYKGNKKHESNHILKDRIEITKQESDKMMREYNRKDYFDKVLHGPVYPCHPNVHLGYDFDKEEYIRKNCPICDAPFGYNKNKTAERFT